MCVAHVPQHTVAHLCRFAGDEAPVLFADVDKEGMPDLIKLLRR